MDFDFFFSRYCHDFAGFDQQDVQEFYLKLLEWLHNDVNEIKVKVNVPEIDTAGMSDYDGAQANWDAFKQAHRSGGQIFCINLIFFWTQSFTFAGPSWYPPSTARPVPR